MPFNKIRTSLYAITQDRPVVAALAFIILLRILFTGIMGLMPQDAYYFFYSQHLALSYFDHPPVLAYILRLFTDLFGQHVFVIKLANLSVTAATAVAFYYTARLFNKDERVGKSLLLFLSTFMVTILSLVSTPDVPLMLFWCLSLIALHKAVFKNNLSQWLLAGLLMGLAFDSKYTGIFLPAGITLFLVLSTSNRPKLLSAGYWLSMLVFIITISPVITWNVQHDFASFRFQTTKRAAEGAALHVDVTGFFGVIGHQAAILIPILFFGLLFFLFKATKRFWQHKITVTSPTLFLLCFFLPLFGFFMSLTFIYWVKLNWMMPAYLTGIIWVSRYFTFRWIRYQVLFSVILHAVLAFEIIFYPVPVQSDDTWFGWDKLAEQVKTIKASHPGSFVFSADDYKTSAVLNFYFTEKVYFPNVIGRPALQLDVMPDDLPALAGKNAIFIDSEPRFSNENKSTNYPAELDSCFDSVEQLSPILIKSGKKTVRKFLVYVCTNYHPMPVQ